MNERERTARFNTQGARYDVIARLRSELGSTATLMRLGRDELEALLAVVDAAQAFVGRAAPGDELFRLWDALAPFARDVT